MSIPLRVLLIEDSEDDAALLLRELRRAGCQDKDCENSVNGGPATAFDC